MKFENLSQTKQHALKSSILTLVAAILLWYFPLSTSYSPFISLAGSVNTLKQSFFSPSQASSEIIIIGIDNASLNEFGRWPWPRSLQAKLLKQLNQASIIALDILYLEDSPDDLTFSKVLSSSPQLIGALASLPNSEHASKTMESELAPFMISDIIHDPDSPQEHRFILMPELQQLSSMPEPFLPALARSGLVHINHAEDNQQLHYILGMIDDQQGIVVPSFGLQVLQSRYEKNFSIETGRNNRIFFKNLNTPSFILKDYTGVPLNFYKKDIPTISAAQVINNSINPDIFKDKIVLVGFTASGLHDTFISPIGPKKGVELHTTLISNFINDEIIQHSVPFNVISFVLFALFAFIITLIKPNSYLSRFILLCSGVVIIFLMDFLAFSFWNIWLDTFQVLSLFLIAAVMNETFWSISQEYSSGHLRRAFQSYLSKDLLHFIGQNPKLINLGGNVQEASFLFSDIRNFSRLSEELGAQELVKTLHDYFNPMTESILDHKGMLDKYIGDSVMAIFNAPVPIEYHALEACLCALNMNDKVTSLNNDKREQGLAELDMGIGINTGEALIGNMGSDIRFSYTAVGDSVNIASRIESMTKIYKCSILIGETTWKQTQGLLLGRYIDTVVLKGREQPSSIFQIVHKTEKNKRLCNDFNQARSLYSKQEFDSAKDAFLKCFELWNDETSLVFAERCSLLMKQGIPENWEDVYSINTK